jgi:AraC-like DNA-binding protein
LYLGAEIISNIASELTGQHDAIPFFRSTVIFDGDIQLLYLKLCRSIETSAADLARDSLLHELFGQLITRHSEARPSLPPLAHESLAVQRVRDYLTDNYARNVSLDELATVANLSPFHLNRVFRHEVGLPPHAFQVQVRVLRARTALFTGKSAWRFRDPDSNGIMDVENDAVYLWLKQGRNDLVLAVREYFGGWGFICRLESVQGLKINS